MIGGPLHLPRHIPRRAVRVGARGVQPRRLSHLERRVGAGSNGNLERRQVRVHIAARDRDVQPIGINDRRINLV